MWKMPNTNHLNVEYGTRYVYRAAKYFEKHRPTKGFSNIEKSTIEQKNRIRNVHEYRY